VIPPAGDVDAVEFWDALERGTLLVGDCAACGHHWLPPLQTCPRCAARDVTLVSAPASGSLYSWTVIHLAADPAYRAEVPYAVGLVTLDDGTRLYGRIVGVDQADLRDGLPLRVVVGRVDDQPMWTFEPA
jgi:uncharacterized OB-fold protein